MTEKAKKNRTRTGSKGANTDTVIAEGTRLQGEIFAEGAVRVSGSFDGDLTTRDAVIVNGNGRLTGTLRARNVRVAGRVDGEIVCDRISIENGGCVYGEVLSRALIISPGGHFLGSSRELSPDSRGERIAADAATADQWRRHGDAIDGPADAEPGAEEAAGDGPAAAEMFGASREASEPRHMEPTLAHTDAVPLGEAGEPELYAEPGNEFDGPSRAGEPEAVDVTDGDDSTDSEPGDDGSDRKLAANESSTREFWRR